MSFWLLKIITLFMVETKVNNSNLLKAKMTPYDIFRDQNDSLHLIFLPV